MNYNQPSFYYDDCVMDGKLRYLNLKVYCEPITDRLRRVVMRGNPPGEIPTAVDGCYCLGDMAVRLLEVLARPWVETVN